MKKNYGSDPADDMKLDEGGVRIVPPVKTDKMSMAAMKGKDMAKIKRAALAKMLKNKIPASPTR